MSRSSTSQYAVCAEVPTWPAFAGVGQHRLWECDDPPAGNGEAERIARMLLPAC